ncbi:uncharacterized protein YKR070W-like isoform X3 [Durio zibethinus]|uniref:Uncharacterized protein YKR070W-like isoform X3 n=1 Tax=Durio zibethinus TaxID=66656 RepID=A0A6P5Z180_DURZI|nr:uncharacterized protein YKR070W-like isoform X3 [Durio zibethinus]
MVTVKKSCKSESARDSHRLQPSSNHENFQRTKERKLRVEMRFHASTISRVSQFKNRAPLSYQSSSQRRKRCNFGIAFDIDGVILRGRVPIGGSPRALRRLYGDSGELNVPYLFLTNGGGIPETKRAKELSELLGVNIMFSQVVQGHSPFRNLLKKFENELIIATGKGDPTLVMSEYGFKKVVSLEEYASYFESIDPVSQYKRWTTMPLSDRKMPTLPRCDVSSERIKAVFVVSDPVDWGRDIQAAFPSKRLGMGAFRIALESIFNRINPKGLEYVSYGKPNPFVFKNAEAILNQLQSSLCLDHSENNGVPRSHPFKTLYMIGDNPSVDVKGAQQAGRPWFSILTRTGVFRTKDNHAEFPADLVVDTVEEAVDYILKRECMS